MTQTIEQLQARVAELEAQADPEALHIAYLHGQEAAKERIAELTRQRDEVLQFLGDVIDALSDADVLLDESRTGWLGVRTLNQQLFQEYEFICNQKRTLPGVC